MSGQDWSIVITQGSECATFSPQQAQATDLISWNNRTGEEHQPWLTNSSYEPQDDGALTGVIPPWSSSDSYLVPSSATSTTIYYCCRLHPEEQATIVVGAGDFS